MAERGYIPAPRQVAATGGSVRARGLLSCLEFIKRVSVSSHKVEQRRLHHRGREFHFVSYEAQLGNERRGEPAMPSMWYLMNEGKRRPVLPHVPGQELVELDGALLRWVDEQVFGGLPLPQRTRRA